MEEYELSRDVRAAEAARDVDGPKVEDDAPFVEVTPCPRFTTSASLAFPEFEFVLSSETRCADGFVVTRPSRSCPDECADDGR